MNKEQLEKDTAYLIRKRYYASNHIFWVKVIEATQKAYKLQYENGAMSWVKKEEFHDGNVIYETLNL